MKRNKVLLGIILSIILLIFSINGFTAYYKYTQESGANFYVGVADKADALEDTNEMRQIIDDLGALLVHDKRNDLYPKDETTGGALAIPNSALASFATGTKGDLFYCSAANVWTKLNIGTDNQILVVATDTLNFETASSDLLSDVASIAMLNENEVVTGSWEFEYLNIKREHDFYSESPIIAFHRFRDGDPTYNISDGDWLGSFEFYGRVGDSYDKLGAQIAVVVDGTPGADYVPGRLEFWTSNDNYETLLRLEIDSAGNIKMGDGAWTNYVNVSAGGVLTFEGTASIDISSDDLSDVASIGMLDENEHINGVWYFDNEVYMSTKSDSAYGYPFWGFLRARDGDPTYIVTTDDVLGSFNFSGAYDEYPFYHLGAQVRAVAEGTFASGDAPTRLEFLTTPDGTSTPVLRVEIDNAGNVKMGDGVWTNYVNVSAGGAMTAEGTASIKATDLVIASQAAGDILYFNGTNWIRLAIGTAGQILTVNAGGTAPEWQTP